MEEVVLTYDYPIVIISVIIAVFASFTTIELIGRTNKSTKHKQLFLILSAVTMGFGIWAMHFTGMIAMGDGDVFKYEVVSTTGSWLVATFASYFAFYMITTKRSTSMKLLIAAILLGMGIVSMHYLGMSGVIMSGHMMEYNYFGVALSIFLAILGSFLVLVVFAKVNDDYLYIYQFPLATLLGLTVSAMHYTAMESMTFFQGGQETGDYFSLWEVAIDSDILLIFQISIASIMFLTVNTISLRNRSFQNKINYMAFHDSLTGLPNRNLLDQQLEMSLSRCRSDNKQLAVLFLDLNDFKDVNDTFGHEAGDTILKQVSKRLTNNLRDEGVVARLGGDEFIVVVEGVDESLVEEVVNRVLTSFEEPFKYGNLSFVITPSIGISLYPDDAADTKSLIQQADQAMYQAKNHTRDDVQYHFYGEVNSV